MKLMSTWKASQTAVAQPVKKADNCEIEISLIHSSVIQLTIAILKDSPLSRADISAFVRCALMKSSNKLRWTTPLSFTNISSFGFPRQHFSHFPPLLNCVAFSYLALSVVSASGVTSHRQPRQCRGGVRAQHGKGGPK